MMEITRTNYLRPALLLFTCAFVLLAFVEFSYLFSDCLFIVFCLMLFTFSIILIFLNKDSSINHFLIYTSVFMFIVKSIYAYYIYTHYISLFPDSFGYLEKLDSLNRTNNLSFSNVAHISESINVTYIYFIYVINKIFGNIFALYISNIALSTIAIFMFYKIVLVDFSKKIAFYCTLFLLLSSNVFLFSSNILKDSLVLLLTTLVMFIYKYKRNIFLALIIILPLTMTRIYSGASLLLAVFVDYVFILKSNRLKKMVGIASLILFFAIFYSSLNPYFVLIMNFATSKSIVSIIVYPFVSIVKFYFSPLVFNMFNNTDQYAILITDSLFFTIFSYGLVKFTIKMFKFKELRRKMYFYIVPIIVHSVVLGTEYGGDSSRQRLGVLFSLTLILFVGLFYKNETKIKEAP